MAHPDRPLLGLTYYDFHYDNLMVNSHRVNPDVLSQREAGRLVGRAVTLAATSRRKTPSMESDLEWFILLVEGAPATAADERVLGIEDVAGDAAVGSVLRRRRRFCRRGRHGQLLHLRHMVRYRLGGHHGGKCSGDKLRPH